MAEASDVEGIFRQNLLDAGCGSDTITQCVALARANEQAKLLCVLACHRRELLDTVHENEKHIDCLDYLVYQIEKQKQF